MHTDLFNIFLAFFEGFALIISPCILPILPFILSGSLEGSKKRPFGIIIGFVLSFALITFFSRQLVQHTRIDLNLIRHISYVLLFLFGLIMISTTLTEKFSLLTQRLTRVGSNLSSSPQNQGGFFGGIIFGGLIGLIWTPCAGPILAAVIVQTVIQKTNIGSFFVILAFGIGAAVPMLIIALFGRTILNRLSFIKSHTVLFRKILGVIVILSVLYMIYSEFSGAASMSSPPIALSAKNATISATSTNSKTLTLQDAISPYPAPAIDGINEWINSAPLTLAKLKGKVVLIDFWTYSCINCLRTLPYLKDWYKKYHDQGLVIIGVHSPEFEFEHNVNNIKNAVAKYGILYPVAVDNQFTTWQNYKNLYWPAHYLIDKDGRVVYHHFGEGKYDVTENNIRYLLGLKNSITENVSKSSSTNLFQTPETYLGYGRAAAFSSPEAVTKNKAATYTSPQSLSQNAWALQGSWIIASDRIISAQPNAILKINFNANHVFIVTGNGVNHPIKVTVLFDGKPLKTNLGKDIKNSQFIVDQHRLYDIISSQQTQHGILEIIPQAVGLEVYTFTFG